jgi:hypothetical protein
VQLLLDHTVDARGIAKDCAQLGDALLQVVVVALDPLPLERCKRTQPEIQDRARLDLAELEPLHQLRPRRVGVGGCADERDDLVEDVERLEEALEDVRAAAKGTDNLLVPMREALKRMATVGEVCNVMRDVFGVYRPGRAGGT